MRLPCHILIVMWLFDSVSKVCSYEHTLSMRLPRGLGHSTLGFHFLHNSLKALHRFFEVLKNFCGKHIRIGQAVEVGKRLVLNPEKIEAGFIAGQDFVDAVSAEATFRIVRRPGFAAFVPILRMIAEEKLS